MLVVVSYLLEIFDDKRNISNKTPVNVRNTQAGVRIFCSRRRNLTGEHQTRIKENATAGVLAIKFLEEVLRVLFTDHTQWGEVV